MARSSTAARRWARTFGVGASATAVLYYALAARGGGGGGGGGLPLARAECERRIRAGEHSYALPALGALDANALNSNVPIEDYSFVDRAEGGDQLVIGVLDGHGGPECAAVLQQHLSAYVLAALARDKPSNPRDTAHTLRRAFVAADTDVLAGGYEQRGSPIVPAMAGSCALVALVKGDELWVACVGDSRALVLGERDGKLKVTQLSEDQTCKNTNEYRRLHDEHPGEEHVIIRNRVLGGLMPTRAFGDARYKWAREVQDTLAQHGMLRKGTPTYLKTPPYVTADPVVTYYKISPQDKYLVMATDGLYDELSNEQILDCVRDSTLKDPDSNMATNLIRHALAAGKPNDYERIGRLLTIPAPETRRHRDDMTVLVARLASVPKQGAAQPRTVTAEQPRVEYRLEAILKSLAGKRPGL